MDLEHDNTFPPSGGHDLSGGVKYSALPQKLVELEQ